MTHRSHFTIIVQGEGELTRRTYRVPRWALQAAGIAATVAGVIIIAAAILYAPIARAAAKVPGLERQVARLEKDNARIRELAAALDSLQARYDQVRQMVGAGVVPALAQVATPLRVAPALHARAIDAPLRPTGPTPPAIWPLDDPGYVTRGLIPRGGTEEEHVGLDVAVAVGSVVRAAGGGTVLDVGEDPEYGRFVKLGHPQGYETMYGHLSRTLARKGAAVEPGEVIGLSGNSGRSSAPHLHFEVRQDGRPVDPLTLVNQEG